MPCSHSPCTLLYLDVKNPSLSILGEMFHGGFIFSLSVLSVYMDLVLVDLGIDGGDDEDDEVLVAQVVSTNSNARIVLVRENMTMLRLRNSIMHSLWCFSS